VIQISLCSKFLGWFPGAGGRRGGKSSLSFARKCLIAAQQRQKAFADKNCVDKTLKVGDKVLLSTKYLTLKHSKKSRKLLPEWIGPFEVVQVVGRIAYALKMNPRLVCSTCVSCFAT
jgi:hypothetical protein